MFNLTTSEKLFLEACKHIPGGVNSPVRAFKNVGGTPPFIVRAKGAYLYDADGNSYIDYIGSWGPAILGHAPIDVLRTLNESLKNGLSFGAPTPKEIELAVLVKQAFPSIDLLRFVNSGTEATMSAIRAARGFTGKNKIVKLDGCYHGHADYLLVKAGSGAETHGMPNSAGVPASFTEHTLIGEYNNLESIHNLFKKYQDIACLILEPVMGNMGLILPNAGFLQGLRDLCNEYHVVLIFDEVMTGFRVAYGGAQQLYNVKADLTCFGKIIGGGLPVGAYGGKHEIMQCIAPLGPVYQAGTLSGNPLAMAVGCKTLELLHDPQKYQMLQRTTFQLTEGLKSIAKQKNVALQVTQVGSMFGFFFNENPVTNAAMARQSDSEKFKIVFHHLLANGVFIAPSPFEAGFVSLTHSPDDIDRTLDVFGKAIDTLKSAS